MGAPARPWDVCPGLLQGWEGGLLQQNWAVQRLWVMQLGIPSLLQGFSRVSDKTIPHCPLLPIRARHFNPISFFLTF